MSATDGFSPGSLPGNGGRPRQNAGAVRAAGKFTPRLTLTQRLLALVAMAAIPATAGLIYFILAIHQEREREVRDQAFRTSQVASLEIERIITGAQGILQAVALSPALAGNDTAACTAYLDAVSANLPQFRGFDVIDPDGTVICSSRELQLTGEDVAAASWFKDARDSGTFSVGLYSDAQPGQGPYLPLALPTSQNDRQTIVMAGIDLRWLTDRLRERHVSDGGAIVIADRNGVILAREPNGISFVGHTLNDPFPRLIRLGEPGVIETTSIDGIRRIIGYQPPAATGFGLYVGAGVSTKAAFAPIFASTWRSIGLTVLGAFLGCAFVWAVGNRLLRKPLLRIVSTVESWRAGDETARTGIERSEGSEIAQLAAATDDYMDAVLADRTARRLAEEHRSLLLREMSHRIKNLLATVQAIANQTFRDGAGPDNLRAFGQRLSAMAATHDLLVSSSWQSAGLKATVEAALNPFQMQEGASRFDLDGPGLEITARAAFALSMALHELCTNAVKYGALSQQGGRVEIRWEVAGAGEDRRFLFHWQERDGPPCHPPTRTGFGTRLVRAAFTSELDARTKLDYRPEGLRFELDASASLMLVPAARP